VDTEIAGGTDWVELTRCRGDPDNSRCSFWMALKKTLPFYCWVRKALVSKQPHKHERNKKDNNPDQHYRDLGLSLNLRLVLLRGYRGQICWHD
jgi:hypothetical protein